MGPHRALCNLLSRLQRALRCSGCPRLFVFRVVDPETGLTVEGEIRKMKLTETQQCTIEFGAPINKRGTPAKIEEGSVTIECSDDSVEITQDPTNPLKATVVALHPNEEEGAVITITADADLGDGVKAITGTEPLVVVPAEATGFGPVVVSTPEEQP